MPAVQSNYNTQLAVAFVGMIASTRPNTLISREVETALGFGLAAVQGTRDYQVQPLDNVADKFVGISVREQSTPVTTNDTYPVKSTAMLMTLGDIWVQASLAVAAGDPVYVTPAGAWTNVSNSNANQLINDARWDTSTAGAGLAVIALK
jgi:hypothetical protein